MCTLPLDCWEPCSFKACYAYCLLCMLYRLLHYNYYATTPDIGYPSPEFISVKWGIYFHQQHLKEKQDFKEEAAFQSDPLTAFIRFNHLHTSVLFKELIQRILSSFKESFLIFNYNIIQNNMPPRDLKQHTQKAIMGKKRVSVTKYKGTLVLRKTQGQLYFK